jgi:hypothetical protein
MLAAGVMCLVGNAALAADGKPTADEVKALTHKAAVYVADKGIDEARAAFNQEGEFKHGEIYVNVIDSKGAWVIYPPRPDGVGKVVINIKPNLDSRCQVDISWYRLTLNFNGLRGILCPAKKPVVLNYESIAPL